MGVKPHSSWTQAQKSQLSQQRPINTWKAPSCHLLQGSCKEPPNQSLKCLAQFWGKYSHKGKQVSQLTFVVDGLKKNLLGLPAITALGLAVRVDATTDAKTAIKHQYPTIFQGLGNLGEEYVIRLKPGAVPRYSSLLGMYHCRYTPISKN